MEGWMDRMDGWMEGRMDGRKDGWMEGCMEGWMERMIGWMEKRKVKHQKPIFYESFFPVGYVARRGLSFIENSCSCRVRCPQGPFYVKKKSDKK